MKRNAGLIGVKHTLSGEAETNSTSGIFDTFDQHMFSPLWPTTKKYISCTESTSTVAEGASMNFAVVTSGFAEGVTLYYTFNTVAGTAMTDADLSAGGTVQGSFTLSSNVATLNFSFFAEIGGLTENNVFKLEIRTGSTSGTIVMESGNVTVTDVVGTDIDIYIHFYESRYGAHIGTIYHYVTQPDGTILHTFGTTSGHSGSANWISVNYSGNVYALTPGTDFRLAWRHDAGSSYRGDYAVDYIKYYNDGALISTYSFESGTLTGWLQTNTYNTTSSTAALTNSVQVAVTTSTGYGKFNIDSNGTPSGSTGPNGAHDGTYFAYTETSSYFNGKHWLFSPVITA